MVTAPEGPHLSVEVETFAPLLSRIVAFLADHGAAIDRWTRHHPASLPFDGHAYRRRTKNRTRRNR